MKLDRAWLVAAAVLVGSVAMVGCHRADEDSDDAQLVPTEQASVSGAEVAQTASTKVGVEQFARGGGAHGGAHGGGRSGWNHGGHGGWARGGRWDGWRRDHRYFPWW